MTGVEVRRSPNYPHGVRIDACAHLQCDRPRWRSQLCESHFRRMERGASIAPPIGDRARHEPRPARCAVWGCPDTPTTAHVCPRHVDQNPTERPPSE